MLEEVEFGEVDAGPDVGCGEQDENGEKNKSARENYAIELGFVFLMHKPPDHAKGFEGCDAHRDWGVERSEVHLCRRKNSDERHRNKDSKNLDVR